MIAQDVKTLPVGKKIYDHVVKGLFCIGNPSGTKSFFLVYRDAAKKQRKIRLGLYGQLTLEGARKAAQELLGRIAVGENPALDRQKAKAEMTVYELMAKVLREYWNTERYRNSGQFKQVIWSVKKDFSKIGHLKLSELSTLAVTNWHKSFKDKPSLGNHALSYLKTAINWAIKNDITAIKNPCSGVKKYPSHARSRYATPEEIKKIGSFLEQEFETNPLAAIYLYLILTTGTRPQAVERLKWENLIIRHNLKGEEVGVISFFGKSSARTGEKEMIIVPPKTLAMIKRLPRTSEYIVPRKKPYRLWWKIQEKFNCPDLWARDLRRTYATVGLSSGVALSQVGELLNHKCWETTKVYAKLMDEQRINSAMQIADKIEDIIQH